MPSLPDPRQRRATLASQVLMAAALLLIMWQGLLPGLLCVCLGFVATRWLSPHLGRLMRMRDGAAPQLAATLVALLPLVLAALHNLHYYLDLTTRARAAILAGTFHDFKTTELKRWES